MAAARSVNRKAMRYFRLPNVGGRFGNQLYFCLHAHVRSLKTGEPCKYVANGACRAFKLEPVLLSLGMGDHFCAEAPAGAEVETLETTDYLQKVGVDFAVEQLRSFVEQTVLRSPAWEAFREKNPAMADRCAVHIRQGDYRDLPQFDCFDRERYLETCLSYVNVSHTPHKYSQAAVVSDDVDRCRAEWHGLLSRKFSQVDYVHHAENFVEDMLYVASSRMRILWNSTFSFWAGFIGSVLDPDTAATTFAPDAFTWGDTAASHCMPGWPVIHTPVCNY